MQYFDQSSPFSPNEILELVAMQYSLDQEIADRLELSIVAYYISDNRYMLKFEVRRK